MSLPHLLDVPAPAKINLFLHVVGQRPDGYHLLQSVFALIDWADTLHFERRSDGRLSREDLGPTLPPDDLCLRAARALQQASGTSLGAHIQIDKQVPWGAGLGGGSSDAASTLLALNRLWGLNWPRAALLPIALALGADVPFFVGGHNAWVEGIGERLTPIDLPPMRLAVLKPALAIPTAAIFGSPLLRRDSPLHIIADFLADAQKDDAEESRYKKQSTQIRCFGRNDLQASALSYSEQLASASVRQDGASEDELAGALRLMTESFGNSRMSGSGSAVFSVLSQGEEDAASAGFEARSDTESLQRVLATAPPDWTGRLCHSLALHPLCGWAVD